MELEDLREEVLVAAIIKKIAEADGIYDTDEMIYINDFLEERHVNPRRFDFADKQSLETLLNLISVETLEKYRKDFVDIANADGDISKNELDIIKKIARKITINAKDTNDINDEYFEFQSNKSWFYYSKSEELYVYQAYLPNYKNPEIDVSVRTNLSFDANRISIFAKRVENESQRSFSDQIITPKFEEKSLQRYFENEILTLKFPHNK